MIKTVGIYLAGLSLPILLSCQGAAPEPAETAQTLSYDEDQKNASVSRIYGTSVVRNWRVLGDRTLLIEAGDGKKYVATFHTRCPWLRSASAIAFVTTGYHALDRTTRVVSPEGLRCVFNSFKPYVPLETSVNPGDLDISE